MAHIKLSNEYHGLRGLLTYRSETAAPMAGLAQVLLNEPHATLSAGERELIAAYVSSLNECKFCTNSHSAIAKNHLNDGEQVKQVLANYNTVPISAKLKVLLSIANKVQSGGENVLTADIDLAKATGATDLEMHYTMLIAATSCMFNRYVDGLAIWQPDDEAGNEVMAGHRVKTRYTVASLNINQN